MSRALAIATAIGLLAGAAQAQSPSTDSPAVQLPPGNSLSDKLDKADGVIKPAPDIDPKIAKPTPPDSPGSMPVVPPPGSPGGLKGYEPK